jgi:hypothetical protein
MRSSFALISGGSPDCNPQVLHRCSQVHSLGNPRRGDPSIRSCALFLILERVVCGSWASGKGGGEASLLRRKSATGRVAGGCHQFALGLMASDGSMVLQQSVRLRCACCHPLSDLRPRRT